MIIEKNFNHTYPNDPLRNLNFDKHLNIGSDLIFFLGTTPPETMFLSSNKKKIFFSSEEQFTDMDSTDHFSNFVDKILTICPPSITKRKKRKSVFWPIDFDLVKNIEVTDSNKVYDVCYFGGNYGIHINEIINCINSYKSCHSNHNINIDYLQKLKLISESKISVCHNLLPPSANKGFTPQLKTRCFEAGFCKSLMLVLRDEFNIIEEWFVPDEDFIYYDFGTLNEKVSYILNNYNSYQSIIDSAYNKCVNNYTTKHFVERYLNE